MTETVDITLPVTAEAAARLAAEPALRERVIATVNRMLRPEDPDPLFEAIRQMKAAAHARGLTDEILDEELAAWNAERRDRDASREA